MARPVRPRSRVVLTLIDWRGATTWLLAATLLAIGTASPLWHSHDHRPPRAVDACRVVGVHLADHPDAPDLSAQEACPACVLQAQALGVVGTALLPEPCPSSATALAVAQVCRPAPPSRVLGRAPPTLA